MVGNMRPLQSLAKRRFEIGQSHEFINCAKLLQLFLDIYINGTLGKSSLIYTRLTDLYKEENDEYMVMCLNG